MATHWEHFKIEHVIDNRDYGGWLIGVGEWMLGIPLEKHPDKPRVGDVVSIIGAGAYVIACSIGERLIWDDRFK